MYQTSVEEVHGLEAFDTFIDDLLLLGVNIKGLYTLLHLPQFPESKAVL